jgi:hypothetical protein
MVYSQHPRERDTEASTGEDTPQKTFEKKPLRLGDRGMSTAYALILGLLGLGICGFIYTVLDQVVLGDVWNFAVSQQLDGNMLQTFSMLWKFIPVLLTFVFFIGLVVNSHITRNDPYA